ncbi:MAG: saccharopine dehydrogenase NADP-binding domain-containing protein [Thermoplasmata archaeon]|nr:saccharopine dehydrogenase NADP-binding domain-containing protein [Thermoplasmata archaeon]
MKKVLVLGAGLVAKPMVVYLLDHGFGVTVASRTVSKAEALIGSHENGKAIPWTVDKEDELKRMVAEHDISVSLLPPAFHVMVAKACLENNKPMVTTSYVSDAMKALDGEAKSKNLVLLNEAGLDPGIDHMSAMKIIHEVEAKGGKVISFRSTTGALQAFEANNNPFGYKFSWAPKGVLQASKNASKWLEDGQVREYPGEQLFENYRMEVVPEVGTFENYPNRNSVPYKEIYGLKDAQTVYRGTFRMTGWCETMRNIVALGWLGEEPLAGFTGKTFADATRHLTGAATGEDVEAVTAKFLGLKPYATVIKRLGWLGLFCDRPLPEGKDNPLDWMNVLSLEKMSLGDNERDMIVMHHEFVAEYSDKKELITSTFLDFGILGGDTSIARTVSLPAAIAVRMVLEGKITAPGVHIPVSPGIYSPILDELSNIGINFKEVTTGL